MASPHGIPEDVLEALKVPTQYQKVYKDECAFTFVNPYHKDGVYLNLKTFIGVSKEFLPLDQKRSKFPLYLLQQWTRVIKPSKKKEGSQASPTVFAVGVEGGFQLPEDKIETVVSTSIVLIAPDGEESKRWAYDSKTAKESFPELLVKVVETCLSRTDATKEKAGFSLEEEVKVSRYAKDLIQLENAKKIPNDPTKWKCEDSGLTKNLWLNLSTGYIGSGRKETGGTEAAIRHWEETGKKYPLVVKLGTITPDKADVYSYAEYAMVIDPYLDKHLKHWGIDRSKLYQTDEDMNKINIQANIKGLEASRITGDSEKQLPASGVGFQGLVNFGNTCYLNSTFQLLFSVPLFQQRYVKYAKEIFGRSPSDPTQDLTTQLCKLGLALNSDKYQKESEENKKLKTEVDLPSLSDPAAEVTPKMLKKAVAKDHFQFSSGRQQDAQEYILHVFKAISRDARQFPNTPGVCDLTKIFEFATEEKTVDGQSKQVGLKVQKGLTFLTLPIPKAERKGTGEPIEKKSKTDAKTAEPLVIPLEKCIEKYLEPSVLDSYTSPVTSKKGVAYRSNRMRTFPPYLLIQMYRFEQVDLRSEGKGFQIQKIRRQVPMPEKLDLKALRSTGLLEGETALPKKKAKKPAPKPDIVAAVQNMGFSKNAGIRAALATKNVGAEQAVNWVLQNMENPDLNAPVTAVDDEDDADVDPSKVGIVSSMGFKPEHAKKALIATKGDVQRAIEWLFSRTQGELDREEKKSEKVVKPGPNTDESMYEMIGFISHIGDNANSGHYVCHLKRGSKWALFNDNKVTWREDPPFSFGYIYLYARKDKLK